MAITPTEWHPSPGFILDSENKPVIFADQNVALMAGPGTGKTEILAQRACYLLETERCPFPKRILALTYTRSAARNLRDRVLQRCGSEFAQRLDSLTVHAFARLLVLRFQAARTLIDVWPSLPDEFEQMLVQGAALLTVPSISRLYRTTYSHVFLDEFQDMTKTQYTLLKALFKTSGAVVTAAGDDDQRIMGFNQNLIPESFRSFCDDFAAEPVSLITNRRSNDDIRACQQLLATWVKGDDSNADGPYPQSSDSIIIYAPKFPQDETPVLTDAIVKVLSEGIHPHDIAILTRKNTSSTADSLVHSLTTAGVGVHDARYHRHWRDDEIPRFIAAWLMFVFSGGPKARKSVIDMIAHSRYLPDNDSELERSILHHLGELTRDARKNLDPQTATDVAIEQYTSEALRLFGTDAPAVLARVRRGTEGDVDISALLKRYVSELRAIRASSQNWLQAVHRARGTDSLHRSSIHAAKGLQYDTVVLLDVNDEAIKNLSADNDDGREMRSVLYVAASRAKARLWVSTGAGRLDRGAKEFFRRLLKAGAKFHKL